MATLTYNYARSTAVVGPLAAEREPHSWDLCASHALRISPPLGWNLVRHPDLGVGDDPDLTALLDAVIDTESPSSSRSESDPDWLRRLKARQRPGESAMRGGSTGGSSKNPPQGSSPARRAHLRVVHPDE